MINSKKNNKDSPGSNNENGTTNNNKFNFNSNSSMGNNNNKYNVNSTDNKCNQGQTNSKRETSFSLIHPLVKTFQRKLVDIFSI